MDKFFTPVIHCYDDHCHEIAVAWVPEFEELCDKDVDIAILSRRSGEFKPGMYIRQDGIWWLALNYEALCFAIAKKHQLTVIRGLNTVTPVAPGVNAFRNGFQVKNATQLEPGIMFVWVLEDTRGTSGGGTGGSGVLDFTDMFGTPIATLITA